MDFLYCLLIYICIVLERDVGNGFKPFMILRNMSYGNELQISLCSKEVHYDLPKDNNTMVSLLRNQVPWKNLRPNFNKAMKRNPMASSCHSYPRPTSVKVARLMLEMFRNLEGKDNSLVDNLVEKLIQSKVLVEASLLESLPDFNTLAKTYATFPRIMAVLWLTVTDPNTIKNHGWCSIDHMSKYLSITKPARITSDVNELEQLLSGMRNILKTFIMKVADPISAQSFQPEEHGRRQRQEQSASMIKSNVIPRFDDGLIQMQTNQKSRRRRQESHYQIRFGPSDGKQHKQRRRIQPPRGMNVNSFQQKKKVYSHYKMVRVVSEAGSVSRKIFEEPPKKGAASYNRKNMIHCVSMLFFCFVYSTVNYF